VGGGREGGEERGEGGFVGFYFKASSESLQRSLRKTSAVRKGDDYFSEEGEETASKKQSKKRVVKKKNLYSHNTKG